MEAFPDFSFRQLPPASVSFCGLPHPHIWFNSGNMTRRRGVGAWKPKLLGQFYLKIDFAVAFRPILAPVSIRRLPSDSSDLRLNSDNVTLRMGGGRKAKAHGSILTLTSIFQRRLPNFSFRQLPSASASFRGLPPPHILFNSDNMTCRRGGARNPKFLGHFLP